MEQPTNKDLFQFLDITTLSISDTEDSVRHLVSTVLTYQAKGFVPAAICVYPNFSALVSSLLRQTPIATAAVAGGFPASQSFLEVKVAEAEKAVQSGANEVDIVLNVGQFLMGNDQVVINEISELKAIIGSAKLKVILETGVLKDTLSIQRAARLAIQGGADFLKTSTGKVDIGATPEAVRVMCEIVKEEQGRTGKKIGIKVSGGVRTKEDALVYFGLVHEILGEDFCRSDFFRIGASSLADALVNE
jgi:deoxyribose-phosphate aldolase